MVKKVSVSVIIPYYNAAETIERSIQSIARQTVLPEEVIIVDDDSSEENTNEILLKIKHKYELYFNVVLLRMERNSGPGSARNRGWNIAKGRYIAFLDADDAWHPQKLSIQYNIMKRKRVEFSCAKLSISIANNSNKRFKKIKDEDKIEVYHINKWKTLFIHNPTGTPTVMLEKSIGLRFEENMHRAEDYLLYLKIIYRYQAVLIRENLAVCFKSLYGESGLTQDLWKLEKGELSCYYILAKDGYISFLVLPVLYIWSYLKYLRRILIVRSRSMLRLFGNEI